MSESVAELGVVSCGEEVGLELLESECSQLVKLDVSVAVSVN